MDILIKDQKETVRKRNNEETDKMTCFKKLNKNTVAILNSSSNSWNSSQTIGLARKMSNRGLIVDNSARK